MSDPDGPGLPAPPGEVVDFVHPFTLQPYQIVTVAGCVIFTTVAVAARLITKIFVIKRLNWEDYTCAFAWVIFMVYLGIQDSLGYHGGGAHQWNVTLSNVQYNFRFTNYGDMFYSLTIFSTKLSIMLLILRVFCSVHRDVAYFLTWSLIVLNSIFYALFFFIPIFECSPRARIWDKTVPGKCLDVNVLYLSSAIFNMVSDIAMLSVPIYMITKLQMSIQRKIGIIAIFSTGGLACVSSIIRLVYILPLIWSEDFTYFKMPGVLWSMAEIAFGLLCSCLVVLPRLFQHLAAIKPYPGGMSSKTLGHSDGRSTKQGGGAPTPAVNRKTEWVQLSGSNGEEPTPPLKEGRTVHMTTKDDQAIGDATVGKEEGWDLRGGVEDVEKGISTAREEYEF